MGGLKNTRTHRVFRVITIPLLIASQLSAGVSSSARADTAPDTGSHKFLWDELQPNDSARIAGFADLDGRPGDEVLIDSGSGFYVASGDGSVLWRYQNERPMPPSLVPDVDGDARPDVLAQAVITWRHPKVMPTDRARAVLLSGATGEPLWQTTSGEKVGYHTPPLAADLNADGHLDLVLPGYKDFYAPHFQTLIQVYFGPDFSNGWVEAVPGAGTYNDPSQMDSVVVPTMAIGNLDEDATAEVVVGTVEGHPASATEGFLTVLEGESGAEKWSVRTGGIRRVALHDRSVVAYSENPARVSSSGVAVNGRVGGLAAHSGSDGSLLWSRTFTGDRIYGPLLVGDLDGIDGTDEIVLTNARWVCCPQPQAREITMRAFSADGIPRWQHVLQRTPYAMALVSRADGGSDVGYGTHQPWEFEGSPGRIDSTERVGLVAGLTGVPRWTLSHEPEAGRDAIEGVGGSDIDGDGVSEFVYSTSDQHLIALDPQDGSLRFERSYPGAWTTADAGDIDGDAAVDIVGGGPDGLVRAIRADGRELWSQPVGGTVAGLRVQEGYVLGVNLGRHAGVFSLDSRTGAKRWDLDVGYASHSSGTRSHLHAALGDLDGDGTEDAVVAAREYVTVAGTEISATSEVVVAVNGETGEVLWKTSYDPSPQNPPAVSIVEGDVVVVTYPLVDDDAADLVEGESLPVTLFDGATGTQKWVADFPSGAARGPADSAVGFADLILVPFGPFTGPFNVNAYRSSDGSLAWSKTFECPPALFPVGDQVVAITRGLQNAGDACVLGHEPMRIIEKNGDLREIDGGALAGHTYMAAAGVAPGAGFVFVTGKGLGPGHGVYLLDLEALVSGRVEVVRRFHLPQSRISELPYVGGLRIASTTSGPVAVGFNTFFIGGSGTALQRPALHQAWALQLLQES